MADTELKLEDAEVKAGDVKNDARSRNKDDNKSSKDENSSQEITDAAVSPPAAACSTSAAFLSITFQRLAVSPACERSARRFARTTAVCGTHAAAGPSESRVLGRNGRRRSAAAGLLRRSKLTDIVRNRDRCSVAVAASSKEAVGATDAVSAGGSESDRNHPAANVFGKNYSAAFENFASLSLEGDRKSSGGEGSGAGAEQAFSTPSYRSSSCNSGGKRKRSTTPEWEAGRAHLREGGATCGEAARLYSDITADDLAGYLEDTLIFPKKMSYMAELMYT